MRVVATAGHVDHGKSTLVRALTGMEPDRWAEERRRGVTIDLGYAWLCLDGGEQVAFVDVPGHQRFIGNMLAGLGPAPAVMLVIAADEGWRRQTSEHLDAVQALGIRHGLVAVTRSDLADPAPVLRDALARLEGTSLGGVAAVSVSGQTGQGLAELRSALAAMLATMPQPRRDGPVRLWVDRSFTVQGSGTVVTGTLGAGSIRQGQTLELNDRPVRVRGLQQLGSSVDRVEAVSRVAVNLRGLDRHRVRRGDCLLTPQDWRWTDSVDVALEAVQAELNGQVMVHVGSAAVAARVRMFSDDAARLLLNRQLPLRVGDRAVIRDPGQQVVAAGAVVIDPDPPALNRRGAAAARGAAIATGEAATLTHQVGRRGAVRAADLRALGINVIESPEVLARGGWLIDPGQWQRWLLVLGRAVEEHAERDRQQPTLSTDAARRAIGLADPALLAPLAAEAGLESVAGRIGRPGTTSEMGPAEPAIASLEQRWLSDPLDAPDRTELSALGLGNKELATASATGRLIRLAADVVVAPRAIDQAIAGLRQLPGPFSASDARRLLGVSRRVAIPLLEQLDSLGLTARIDAVQRIVTGSGGHRASGAITS